jgi:hypothetical protein
MVALGTGFRAAQVAAVLLAAFIPLLATRLGEGLGAGRRTALLGGVLSLLPGFYTPYLLTTDTFAVFAVVGGLLWWQLERAETESTNWRWLGIGATVALGSLARADGLLLWAPVVYASLRVPGRRLRFLLSSAFGFLALMAPWWIRNLAVTGSLVAPGAARALWVLDYDELFLYPASQLTIARWWAAGLEALLAPRLAALWANLTSALAVNGYVLLLPLMVVGGWAHRRRVSVRAAALYAGALYLFMSLVFPFAGSRGGFFHSTAALMPLAYALAAAGLEPSARWLAARLHWDPGRTQRLLTTVALGLAAALSLWALMGKAGVFGRATSFARNRETYAAVAQGLDSVLFEDAVVASVNPPGLFLATGWRSVVLPHGPVETLREVVKAFGVDWIVVEEDHPAGLDDLYTTSVRPDWLAAPVVVFDAAGRPVYLYRVQDAVAP